MTLRLTRREAATLATALQVWQQVLSRHTLADLAQRHPQLQDHEPLSIAEVDGLLWRLADGASALSIEDSEASVSSASTVSITDAGGAS